MPFANMALIGAQPMNSGRITIGEHARDFTLEDTRGRFTRLSDYEGHQIVYLVFNRGFA